MLCGAHHRPEVGEPPEPAEATSGARAGSLGGLAASDRRAPRLARPVAVVARAPGRSTGYPRATLSFYTVIDCHWLPLLSDLHSSLAIIFCQNDSVVHG
jgi:hypothetical protein